MAYTEPTRARIPGTIQGYSSRDRLRTVAADAAARQDNWAKHFGGATSKETADAAEVKTRVAAMEKNQDVEDTFRRNRGMPPVGGEASRTTAYKYGVDDQGTTTTNLSSGGATKTVSAPAPAPAAIKARVLPTPPPAGASMGVVERGPGENGGDVRYKDGTTITQTPARRVLASRYGTGSATYEKAPSNMPAATPLTAVSEAVKKIPVVGKAIDTIRGMVGGGGQKTSAKITPPASAPAAPKGSTPTKAGGYMSITGAPRRVAAPQPSVMEQRDAQAKQRIMDRIYPERSAKAVTRARANAALVAKARKGDAEFEKAKAGMSPRDRLRITATLAAQRM